MLKFTVDCTTPVEDELMDAGAFVSIGSGVYIYIYSSLIERFSERWYGGLGSNFLVPRCLAQRCCGAPCVSLHPTGRLSSR